MREIKFRAWDRKDKVMRTVDDIEGLWTLNNHEGDAQTIPHVTAINQSYAGEDRKLVVDKDCDLMQYTGLKDKNGREIYEGDVVHKHGARDKIISWKNGRGFVGWNIANGWNTRWEIIGNIYQNPELLT